MDTSVIPGGVAALCARLRAAGREAYPVGGCVRDLLLGRAPGDWDVTTSAQPEEVMALFDRTVPTGIKHGTVTVLTEDGGVEVTTFRAESGYADGRHPDAVTFGGDLAGDLSRRDFTINAMALGPDGAVIDPFGGRRDLADRVIRCVGEPERRFREDALRMLRAVRFSAQLGFAIESATAEALRKSAGLTARLSAERVRTELEKTLLSPWPERGEGLFAWGLLSPFVGAEAQPDLTTLHRVAASPLERWAALCALLLDEGDIVAPGPGGAGGGHLYGRRCHGGRPHRRRIPGGAPGDPGGGELRDGAGPGAVRGGAAGHGLPRRGHRRGPAPAAGPRAGPPGGQPPGAAEGTAEVKTGD